MANKKEISINTLQYYACSLRERLILFQFQKEHPEVNICQYTSWSGTNQYDAWLTSGNTIQTMVEVKIREFRHDQFTTTFIEPSKLNFLQLQNDQFGTHTEYWNFYKDGILEVFDMSNIEYKETAIERCGKDQFESAEIDDSIVIELFKNNASLYTYDATLNFNAMAITELARRMPDVQKQIQNLNLSKYQSYVNRKNNN